MFKGLVRYQRTSPFFYIQVYKITHFRFIISTLLVYHKNGTLAIKKWNKKRSKGKMEQFTKVYFYH